MTASRTDIERWLTDAKTVEADYLIVAVDTFDYDNYPIYCRGDEECRRKYNEVCSASMQRVDEVYNLSLDLETQLNTQRVMNLPK